MKVIRAPNELEIEGLSIFLAGSIEMGKAEDWQGRVERELSGHNVTILNPRRDDWDASWVQSIHNPRFYEQVEWELSAQEKAHIIAMYFAPGTKSPISLLEFGLFGRTGKMIVCCPDGFWRKGNVDIICQRYGIREVESLDDLIVAIIVAIKGGLGWWMSM